MNRRTILTLKSKLPALVFFIIAAGMLFLGFYRNQWQMARPKKFSSFEKDVESYILARMVISRQQGLFSYGGLLGWGDVVNPLDVHEADYDHQYDVYLKEGSFQSYWAKESHPGFQGDFFSLLDRLSPFSAAIDFRLFRMLTAGLFALVLCGIAFWFYQEFGWLSAIFVLGSSLISNWMTLFGRNLFFVSWIFFLPMLVLLFWFRNEKDERPYLGKQIFWLVFFLVLFKCLFNGYDFILPTLGMVATPVIFYGLLNRWKRELFLKRFTIVVLASLAGILASLMILVIQVAITSGNVQAGIDFIIQTILRRTYNLGSNPSASLNRPNSVSVWSILGIYLSASYFEKIRLPYWTLIMLFAGFSIVYWLTTRWWKSDSNPKGLVLVSVTGLSLLSPLSWYIIFKSLAYYHTHMNYLPWHMPFTIFGFGLCGYILEFWVRSWRNRFQGVLE